MTEIERFIIVRVLAATDAIWVPLRTWNRPLTTNVYFARQAFHKSGVPWESGGATEAERKSLQRALEGLAQAGAVEVRKPNRVRSLSVRLCDDAEDTARRLVGMTDLCAAWVACHELARHSKRPGDAALLTDAFIRERLMCGDVSDHEYAIEADSVQRMLLPALARGRVIALADCRGCVHYALTRSGWEWLDTEPLEHPETTPDAEMDELYRDHLAACRERLETAQNRIPELGDLPLPVSTEGILLQDGSWQKMLG